jgi:DNA topoisomerase VI subunit B
VGCSRGQQGLGLKGVLAVPYVLSGEVGRGETLIESQGVRHRIIFATDPIRRVPQIEVERQRSTINTGTRITVQLPNSASSIVVGDTPAILSFVQDVPVFNPHCTLSRRITTNTSVKESASNPRWAKWGPSQPIPIQWHTVETFKTLMAAQIAADEDAATSRTVRDFISQFRGMTSPTKQSQLLNLVDAFREPLAKFFGDGRGERIERLYSLLCGTTRPPKPADLGLIGEAHFRGQLRSYQVDLATFQYKRRLLESRRLPYVIEAAFGYAPGEEGRTIIAGVNWSPSLSNPFADLLDTTLGERHCGDEEPIVLVVHLATPRPAFTDRAKDDIDLPEDVCEALISTIEGVTAKWTKTRRAEIRDESRRTRRLELLHGKPHEITIKEAAEAVMEQAFLEASDDGEGGRLPPNARQIMYAARRLILAEDPDQKLWSKDKYFTQTLLPDFINANPELTASWNVVYDDRGHFAEPHTGVEFGLGTLAVREYLESIAALEFNDVSVQAAHVHTRGPQGRYKNVLFVEKEGFAALLDHVQLSKRFDIAVTSTKGMSVTAFRELIDHLCGKLRVRVLVLHDFDTSGRSIFGTLGTTGRRYAFKHNITGMVIDLGLRLADVEEMGLDGEPVDVGKAASRPQIIKTLRRNGTTEEEIEYLLGETVGGRIQGRRVELNELTSRQFVDFVERKLVEHGVTKFIPSKTDLAKLYRLSVRSLEIEQIVERERAKKRNIAVPPDLQEAVKQFLEEHPAASWDEAVVEISKVHSS